MATSGINECDTNQMAACGGRYPCIDLQESTLHHHMMILDDVGQATITYYNRQWKHSPPNVWTCVCNACTERTLVGQWTCPGFYTGSISISSDFGSDFTTQTSNTNLDICAEPTRWCVVNGQQIKGVFNDVESARQSLGQVSTGMRMVCEMRDTTGSGLNAIDPHKVRSASGVAQHFSQNTNGVWNAYWGGWTAINTMIEACETQAPCAFPFPTASPTVNPTQSPSQDPTATPTSTPTKSPSPNPTTDPTLNPTQSPSRNPTATPTLTPTSMPLPDSKNNECDTNQMNACRGSFPCLDLKESLHHHHMMTLDFIGQATITYYNQFWKHSPPNVWTCVCSDCTERSLVGQWTCPGFYSGSISISSDFGNDFSTASTNTNVHLCAEPARFCVVVGSRIEGVYNNVESARARLGEFSKTERMVCKMQDLNGLGIRAIDPHDVLSASGVHQHFSQNTNGVWNAKWAGWTAINRMSDVCNTVAPCATYCGDYGNNDGAEVRRLQVGDPCSCQLECDRSEDCGAWTYIPDGLFDMGSNDCVIRSEFGAFTDNCDGRCSSGPKSRPSFQDLYGSTDAPSKKTCDIARRISHPCTYNNGCSKDECENFCAADSNCMFFFSNVQGGCQLYDSCYQTRVPDIEGWTQARTNQQFREILDHDGCKFDHTVLSVTLERCADLASEKGFIFFSHGVDANSYVHCAFYTECTVTSYGPSQSMHQLYELLTNKGNTRRMLTGRLVKQMNLSEG